MFKRLHALRNRLYERFMRFMTRFGPKLAHVNDEPFTVLWKPASGHFCPHCDWIYMMWDVAMHFWVCPQCGIECHPPLAITEKRSVIALPAPKPTITLRQTGDLARNYQEHLRDKEKGIAPVGDGPVRRLGTADGTKINTDQLTAYPHFKLDNRRTG